MFNACPARKSFDIYEPRHPRKTHYFKCVEAHFENLEMVWDDRYQGQYGFFRPYVREVIYRYLDCGDLHLGFARVRCTDSKEGMITDFIIDNMMNWHHSGFNVYCGKTLWPDNEEGLKNLARHTIWASFSSERMMYIPTSETKTGTARVIHKSKNDTSSKTFKALDWLAQLTTHIPNWGEQMVRYYGFYSNKLRGMRKKTGADDALPALMEPVLTSAAMWKQWARLIQKVYHVDPLVCPKCQGTMKIISFIEEPKVIRKILTHLDLWETLNHDPPAATYPQLPELTYDDSCAQVPFADAWAQ
jgi:hypothetical protein